MKDWVRHAERTQSALLKRDIFLYTNVKTACSLCLASGSYDAVKDASFKITCPECGGKYWVLTFIPNAIPARIHWTDDEMIQATPGGKFYVGDAFAKINAEYLPLAQACQESTQGKVVVYNHDMTITKIVPMGAFDQNQYKLILKTIGT